MKINSLRFRFALWVGGFLFASLLLFGGYVYASMSRNLYAAVDDALRLSATQTMGLLNVENGHIVLADNLLENDSDMETLRARGFTVRFLGPNDNLLGGFGANWDTPPASIKIGKNASFSTTTEEGGKLDNRVYTLPILDNNQIAGYVQTSQNLDFVQQTLNRLQISLLLGIPFLSFLSAFGGYFLAGRALAPVDAITQTARRISAHDLSARLNLPNNGDELGRLASTFDEMLARLDDSFHRERQFTADASHELRTPLAAMQTIIGVTRSQKRTTTDYEQALDDLGDETNRLRSLTEDLLSLSRAEQPAQSQREQVDLSSLLEDVVETMTPLAEAKGLALACRITANVTVNSDRDGLIRLFVNLLDNAVKFTKTGTITISMRIENEKVRIAIKDTGVGIGTEDLVHIFDRFYRAEPSRTESGAGLGLAIAKQIANVLGGDIAAESELGTGSMFIVTLPAT